MRPFSSSSLVVLLRSFFLSLTNTSKPNSSICLKEHAANPGVHVLITQETRYHCPRLTGLGHWSDYPESTNAAIANQRALEVGFTA